MVTQTVEGKAGKRVCKTIVSKGQVLSRHDSSVNRPSLLGNQGSNAFHKLLVDICSINMDARGRQGHNGLSDSPGTTGIIVDNVASREGRYKAQGEANCLLADIALELGEVLGLVLCDLLRLEWHGLTC